MKIKKYTLKFIGGKDNKVYLRYFATIEKGVGKTYDKPCDCHLSKDDLQKLNANNLGGIVQKECNRIKEIMVNDIEMFNVRNNTYPKPDLLKTYNNAIYSVFDIEYYTNQFYKSLTSDGVKNSSKITYGYTLKNFKDYFVMNLYNYTISDMINQQVILDFGKWLVSRRKFIDKIVKKDISKISVYNSQMILFKYLNFIAKEFNLPKIQDFIVRPQSGQKYHITEDDVQRILKFKPNSLQQKEVLDIIKINKYVGLRIGEVLSIDKRNVVINGTCKINFKEHKKDRPRTVVIVNKEAIKIITDHMKHNYNLTNKDMLFHFNDRSPFNTMLRVICKEVFKEEKVLVYKQTEYLNDYTEYLKYKVISSHAFRRFAIERNVAEYGIETARTLSGHSDYTTIIKHYSDFLNENDLEKKLLKK
jgi:integrase